MNTNGSNEPNEPTNGGITRRQLLRRSAVGAGTIGAVGVGSTQLPDDYQPIENAEAAPPLAAVAAVAAVGFAGVAAVDSGIALGNTYLESRDIFNQGKTVFDNVEAQIIEEANRVGAEWDSEEEEFVATNQHDNQLTAEAVSSALAESAIAFDEGEPVTTAQSRARQVARKEIFKAEYQVVLLWNRIFESFADGFRKSYENAVGDSLFVNFDTYVFTTERSGGVNTGPVRAYPWGEGSTSYYVEHIGNPDEYTGDSDHGIYGERPIMQGSILNDGDLDDIEIDDGEFPEDPKDASVVEMIFALRDDETDTQHFISPYQADFEDEDALNPEFQSQDLGGEFTPTVDNTYRYYIQNPDDSSEEYTMEIRMYQELIDYIRDLYQQEIADNIDSAVSNQYESLNDGGTDPSDYISLGEIARRYDLSHENNMFMVGAVAAGQAPPEEMKTVTVFVDQEEEIEGALFVNFEEDTTIESGTIIGPNEYVKGTIFHSESDLVTTVSDEELEIEEIHGGSEITYTNREYHGPDAVDRESIEERVSQDSVVLYNLDEALEEFAAPIPQGSTRNWLLALAGASVGAYLLGSGSD